MTDREIMQQALEALEEGLTSKQLRELTTALRERLTQPEQSVAGYCKKIEELITERDELRSRLAQPEQEPVAGECKSEGLNVYWYATHGMIQVTFE